MKTLLHTPIGAIEDEGIHHVVQDLCEMLRWRENNYLDYTFSEFLQVASRHFNQSFSLDHIAMPRVLDQKLQQLRDHPIYPVCRELTNDDTSKLRGETTLFSFLKAHLVGLQAPVKAQRPLTDYEREIDLIRQRRENGSL